MEASADAPKSAPKKETQRVVEQARENPVRRPASLAEMIAQEQEKKMPPQTPMPDYKKNVERQRSEQRSVGTLLGTVAYGVLALVVAGMGLAGYGAYVIFGELNAQKVTTAQMRGDLVARIEALESGVKSVSATVETHTGDIGTLARQMEVQDEAIRVNIKNERELRSMEMKARQTELKAVAVRVQKLESQMQQTRKELTDIRDPGQARP